MRQRRVDAMDPLVTRDYVTIATSSVTWFLVVAGWVALHKTAAIRARRQEEVALVGDVAKRIEGVRDKAIAYYTATSDSAEHAGDQWRLKYEIKSLASRIEFLRARRPEHYDLESELISLRKAVTGGEFESANRSPVTLGAPVIQDVWGSADRFVIALHEEFEKANKSR